MTTNSGGPHILLFERDQQLSALLTSEFQLAGYEVRTARTAVEVFDAIARSPVRIVLVNLAQAAAGRREFWVALDAQRRGRGVQVMTFRCTNIGGYGADDPEEPRRSSVMIDIEVDGMLGVMNLVEAVRARIPTSPTGSFSRLSTAQAAMASASPRPGASSPDHGFRASRTGDAAGSRGPISSSGQMTVPISAVPSPSGVRQDVVEKPESNNGSASFTEKIRAVIYPGNRSYTSPVQEPNRGAPTVSGQNGQAAQPRITNDSNSGIRPAAMAREERVAYPENVAQTANDPRTTVYRSQQDTPSLAINSNATHESSLEQLSRMVREGTASRSGEALQMPPAPATPVLPQDSVAPPSPPRVSPIEQETVADAGTRRSPGDEPTEMVPAVQVRRQDSISDLPLRASPIRVDDDPAEREDRRISQHGMPNIPPSPVPTSLGSIQSAAQTVPVQQIANSPGSVVSPAATSRPFAAFPAQPVMSTPVMPAEEEQQAEVEDQETVEELEAAPQREQVEQSHVLQAPTDTNVASEDVLINIVQSLPPLPVQARQQTPIVSGRATRSLGSVLLEGHLVQKDRLEVAQNIQRMLRGVDLNYQLGEILLMFKLLTPDQLLAASLLSYGLINSEQISALGRIRQELHAIGLEYDLESLLVLFRILSPEQLREVRASWTS
jgi:hypothetical protein